jgi:hypothetical protein
MSDWNWPSPPPVPFGLLLEELGFSATTHSANTATVATSTPINGFETRSISPLIGGRGHRHEFGVQKADA